MSITDQLTPLPIPIVVAPESLPGQRDLFAAYDEYDETVRRCTWCGDLDQRLNQSIYPATEGHCPECGNPEFSLVLRSDVMATKTQPKPKTGERGGVSPPVQEAAPPKAKPKAAKNGTDGKSPKATAVPLLKDDATARLETIALKLIHPDPHNPRSDTEIEADPETAELADSIQQSGLAHPIVVTEDGPGIYTVVVGHRRRIACRMAGMTEVNCIVRNLTEGQSLALQIVENLHRKDLNPLQEARNYQRAMDELGWTQATVGTHSGRTQGHVSNHVRLLKLPESLQARLANETLTATQGRLLAPLADLAHIMDAVATDMDVLYDIGHPETEPLDADEFSDLLGEVLDAQMAPMADLGYSGPKFKASPEQLKALDIREIGFKGSTEKWAANVELWDELQEAAKQQIARQATKGKTGSTGQLAGTIDDDDDRLVTRSVSEGGQPQVETKTPAEIAAAEAKADTTHQKRLYRYKVKWLQQAVRPRIKELTDAQLLALLLGFMVGYHDNQRPTRLATAATRASKHKFKAQNYEDGERMVEILALDRAKLRPILIAYLEDWTDLDARSFSSDANPEVIEALANELGVDMATSWRCDREFLEINNKDQLVELAKEWKLGEIHGGNPKAKWVEHVMRLENPLPKCLKQLKPVRLD